uniref:Ribosomal protein L13 n=1 Tax=Gronococcus sybilensis TaxID=3028029 RepID=A0A9Y1I2P7_9RHOD|nr:ribosomal protein L13 [Gronococcus sybilensis]
MNKTPFDSHEQNKHNWYIIDASNQTLGRLSTKVASTLKGKHKSNYSPHASARDFIIIINAGKVKVSGNKYWNKLYRFHSCRPGGMKTEKFFELQKRLPNRIIERSVKGMLPKNSLGRKMFSRLKIYSDSSHPHVAQNPIQL